MDEARLCGPNLPTGPIALPALDEKSQMTLMGFEPKTFRPTIRNANHYAAGSRYCGEFSLANFAHSVTFVQPEIVQLVGSPLSLSRLRCEEKRRGSKHDVDGTLNYVLATVPSPPSWFWFCQHVAYCRNSIIMGSLSSGLSFFLSFFFFFFCNKTSGDEIISIQFSNI